MGVPELQDRHQVQAPPEAHADICKRAGVRHFGFHAIRHYVASYLADRQKFSVTQVSRLLRDQSKATTEKYLQVIDPQLRDVMASLEEKSLMDSHTQMAHGDHGP
jgi:integrase